MDRVRRLSMEVMADHKSEFGSDFVDNKKALDKITIIRSKGLKNEIAGYITKHIKHELRDAVIKKNAESAERAKADAPDGGEAADKDAPALGGDADADAGDAGSSPAAPDGPGVIPAEDAAATPAEQAASGGGPAASS